MAKGNHSTVAAELESNTKAPVGADIQKQVNDLLDSGLTQQQLADLVPCGQSTISAFSQGDRGQRPSLEIGTRIAELHKERCPTAKPAALELASEEITFNSLGIDYGLRFDKKEIPDYELRSLINSVHRKFRGINAVSIILQNHEIELRGDSTENSPLPVRVAEGLFDALAELSGDGYIESEELGLRVMKIGGA